MRLRIDVDDLVDATGVAEILGLANRTSVSVYQRRYGDMPQPVVDLGPGRPQLWSRRAIERWYRASSPGTISTTVAYELGLLPRADRGGPMSQYRAVYEAVRRTALGPNPRRWPRTREFAHGQALSAARQVDPGFVLPSAHFERYVDRDGHPHDLTVTEPENTGVVFVPAHLVASEASLKWLRDGGYLLTRTRGAWGDPVYKPSRLEWILHMRPGQLLPSNSSVGWFSLYLHGDVRMAEVYLHRVTSFREPSVGQFVEYEQGGYRVAGTVVDVGQARARIELTS